MTRSNEERMPGYAPGVAHSDEDAPVPEGTTAAADDLGGTLAALADDDLDTAGRRNALARLAGQLKQRGVGDLFKPRGAMRWIADAVGDVVPHLPIRGLTTLREHFPGLSDDEIAERLVRNAARATAAIGAAGGGIAAVEWVATPTLLTAPVLLATETVAVVAVEIKLIGELHELYGVPIEGSSTQRTVALLHSWAQRRGIKLMPGMGLATILGTGVRRELRDRLLKRFGRNLTSYGPMLTGAAVASYLNRRATLALAEHIRKDLRKDRKIIESSAY
ncbi:MAG TPA: hypothetical protein VGJ28_13415 [Micromonosporaceae bacterium]|jgi:uncharacterized protein (DUF697 family)